MFLGIRWSWNAIGCVISAHGSCHGSPQWCPSPPSSPGMAHLNQTQFSDQTILHLSCEDGHQSNTKDQVKIQCNDGFWSQYNMTCSPIDCGLITHSDETIVKYTNLSKTSFGSSAIVSCKDVNLFSQSTFTCTKASQMTSSQKTIITFVVSGWLDWSHAKV